MKQWKIDSWNNYSIKQQPDWGDKQLLKDILNELGGLPSLVFSGETRKLKEEIVSVNHRNKFIIQIGNCAETFSDCHGPKIHNFIRIILQMAMVIEHKTSMKVIKVGRIAGQYAKPRSADFEFINGEKIQSYRGDNINDSKPEKELRIPDPKRLLEGYFRSAATINLIRAFIQGGYGNIVNIQDWKGHFFNKEISSLSYYKQLEEDLNRSIQNKDSISVNNSKRSEIYISHEALLLDYEQAFTRIDTTFGGYYDTSAHFLWVGDRTRDIDGAHIEFVSGIGNPVGIKIGPTCNVKDVPAIIKKINPENKNDKVVLIIRMGINHIKEKFDILIKEIKEQKLNVIWMSDPMHGNTYKHGKYKVRDFKDIVNEIKQFFYICHKNDVIPGGVHLEVTADKVTECIGGIDGIDYSQLHKNYDTKVDPRLNAAQALELSFIIGNELNKYEDENWKN